MWRAILHRFVSTSLVGVALIAGLTTSRKTADAASFAFSGTGTNSATSSSLAAKAVFDVMGGNLQVTLSNIGGDILAPSDVLTAVFFSAVGVNPGDLTPISAILEAGSSVVNDSAPAGGVVGGEWAHESGDPSPAIHTGDQGIGSSGFGYFGDANFPGPDLDSPTAVNGMNYGLFSQSDNFATGNPQVISGGNPFIKHAVVFLLSGIPSGFNPMTDISNVSFQYGTSFTEPALLGTPDPVVPEPASAVMFGVGILGCAAYVARRSRKKTAA